MQPLALVLLTALAPQATLIPNIDYNLDPEGPRAPYADSPLQPSANRLDVYKPSASGKSRPIVLYVHGGGWMVGKKSRTYFKDELFTDAGYVFISVEYRLSPAPVDTDFPANRVRSPQHAEDLAEAIAWVHDNARRFGADGNKILLIGHSAGAQIAALVATDASYLKARSLSPDILRGVVALDSAAYHVPLSIQHSGNPAMKLQAFGTAEENAATDIWTRVSATTHADEDDPPFLLVTQAGKTKRIAQCTQLAKALGQDPASSVFPVAKTHKQINQHLGDPADDSDMTARVLAFVKRVCP